MWVLLSNPISGGGLGKKLANQVREELAKRNIHFSDITSNSAAEASSKLSGLNLREVSGLIVVGGDGLVHLAIQKLANSNLPLLVIPAGTGNDFARTLNLNIADPLVNLSLAFDTAPQSIDLGKANDQYFAQILSTGFDSLVNEKANKMKFIKGRIKYNLAIIMVLSTFKPKHYRFKVDEVSFESKAMLIAISNGKSYGGGMMITPNADLNDGLFDVMILGPVSRLEFIKVFPKVYNGSHINHPAVKFLQGERVVIESKGVVYADGEYIGSLPVAAQVVKNALQVWRG